MLHNLAVGAPLLAALHDDAGDQGCDADAAASRDNGAGNNSRVHRRRVAHEILGCSASPHGQHRMHAPGAFIVPLTTLASNATLTMVSVSQPCANEKDVLHTKLVPLAAPNLFCPA